MTEYHLISRTFTADNVDYGDEKNADTIGFDGPSEIMNFM